MSKPEDIPQGVWDEAAAMLNKAEALAKIGPALEPTAIIARAILAERARCSALLNSGCTLDDGEPVDPAIPEIFHAINEGIQP